MKNILISVIVALGIICAGGVVAHRYYQSHAILRVFRELNHSKTTIFLDEIDVRDCPREFQTAYANYVLEVRSEFWPSSKRLSFEKLENAARPYGVVFR
jgi:hypothetical protein